MKSVDHSAPARPSHKVWPYLVPEPSLVLAPTDPQQQQWYLINWLHIRLPWLYLLCCSTSPAPKVPPQWWHNYLNGDTHTIVPSPDTCRAKQLDEVKKVFEHVLDMSDYHLEVVLTWFNYRMCELDSLLCKRIVWELFELGFRYELLQLDCTLVPLHGQPDAELLR